MSVKKTDKWKLIGNENSMLGPVEYYETGCKKNYAVWHVDSDSFMGWLPKNQVKK